MPDCTYDEVMAIHVIEHFASWDAPAAMNEWVRVLKPGGKLVIECPDMLRVCAMVLLEHTGATKLHPNLTFGGLWGDQQDGNEHMIHRWGYSPDTMKGLMEACGLDEVRTEAPQYHQPIRDMRVVGIKP